MFEFRTIPDDDAKLLFALLDKDGSNKISEDEFMNFGKVMLVEFDRADTYETFVEKHFPRLFNSARYQVRQTYACRIFSLYYSSLSMDSRV